MQADQYDDDQPDDTDTPQFAVDAMMGQSLTTLRQTRLYEAAKPLIDAMCELAQKQASAHRRATAPASVCDEAAVLLDIARRLLSREPVIVGLLSRPLEPDWASLASRLRLVVAGLARYRERYWYYDAYCRQTMWSTQEEWRNRLDRLDPQRPARAATPPSPPASLPQSAALASLPPPAYSQGTEPPEPSCRFRLPSSTPPSAMPMPTSPTASRG